MVGWATVNSRVSSWISKLSCNVIIKSPFQFTSVALTLSSFLIGWSIILIIVWTVWGYMIGFWDDTSEIVKTFVRQEVSLYCNFPYHIFYVNHSHVVEIENKTAVDLLLCKNPSMISVSRITGLLHDVTVHLTIEPPVCIFNRPENSQQSQKWI